MYYIAMSLWCFVEIITAEILKSEHLIILQKADSKIRNLQIGISYVRIKLVFCWQRLLILPDSKLTTAIEHILILEIIKDCNDIIDCFEVLYWRQLQKLFKSWKYFGQPAIYYWKYINLLYSCLKNNKHFIVLNHYFIIHMYRFYYIDFIIDFIIIAANFFSITR